MLVCKEQFPVCVKCYIKGSFDDINWGIITIAKGTERMLFF